jgi:hypothetical protein
MLYIVIHESGLDESIAKRRTISLYLNRAGYQHLQARKKGLLSESDKKIRTKYARSAETFLSSTRMTSCSIWTAFHSFTNTTHLKLPCNRNRVSGESEGKD